MEYRGFRSIKEYESECARIGFKTRRVPFHKGKEPPHGRNFYCAFSVLTLPG